MQTILLTSFPCVFIPPGLMRSSVFFITGLGVLPFVASWTTAPMHRRPGSFYQPRGLDGPSASITQPKTGIITWASTATIPSPSCDGSAALEDNDANPLPSIVKEVVTLPSGLKMELVSALAPVGSNSSDKKAPEPTDEIMSLVSNFLPWLQPEGGKGVASAPREVKGAKKRPPLIFVHGSFHSSWCWSEHYLPYFASQGWDSYAISLRGTSKSPDPTGQTTIKIRTYAEDLLELLGAKFADAKPIIIGHSFGGSVLMKLLEKDASAVEGAAFLCSVPPSGNQAMTARFIKRDFILAMKIVLGFVLKKATDWTWLCRELFFALDLEESKVEEYMRRLKADSVAGIDVKDFLQELPSIKATEEGKAAWLSSVKHRFVLGSKSDAIVDEEGVRETADFVDATAVFVPTSHDVMLGKEWTLAANELEEWLNTTI